MKHRNISFWKAVPHCIMWCLWQERNSRRFEGCEWNILEIKAFFYPYFVGLWCWFSLPLVFLSYTCLIIVFWIDWTSLLVHHQCTTYFFSNNTFFYSVLGMFFPNKFFCYFKKKKKEGFPDIEEYLKRLTDAYWGSQRHGRCMLYRLCHMPIAWDNFDP